MIFILLIVDFIIMALGILKKKEKKEEPAKKEAPKEEKKAAPAKKETVKKEAPKKTEKADDSKKSGGAYFVSPHPDGGWQVKKANAQKALKRFDTKAEAEKYAKSVANNQDTHVVRQKKDGKIQKKH